MALFETIVLALAAVWLAWIALITTTVNLRSMVLFKLIPFGLAACLALMFLIDIGFVIPMLN